MRENHSDLQASSASPPPHIMKKREQRMLLYPSTVDCILVSGKSEVKCALEPTRYQQWVSCGWQTVALLAPSQKIEPRHRPHSSVLKEPPNGPPADWTQNVCVLQLAASWQAKWCHWGLLGEGYGCCVGSSPLLEAGEERRMGTWRATSAESSLLHPGPPQQFPPQQAPALPSEGHPPTFMDLSCAGMHNISNISHYISNSHPERKANLKVRWTGVGGTGKRAAPLTICFLDLPPSRISTHLDPPQGSYPKSPQLPA